VRGLREGLQKSALREKDRKGGREQEEEGNDGRKEEPEKG